MRRMPTSCQSEYWRTHPQLSCKSSLFIYMNNFVFCWSTKIILIEALRCPTLSGVSRGCSWCLSTTLIALTKHNTPSPTSNPDTPLTVVLPSSKQWRRDNYSYTCTISVAKALVNHRPRVHVRLLVSRGGMTSCDCTTFHHCWPSSLNYHNKCCSRAGESLLISMSGVIRVPSLF